MICMRGSRMGGKPRPVGISSFAMRRGGPIVNRCHEGRCPARRGVPVRQVPVRRPRLRRPRNAREKGDEDARYANRPGTRGSGGRLLRA